MPRDFDGDYETADACAAANLRRLGDARKLCGRAPSKIGLESEGNRSIQLSCGRNTLRTVYTGLPRRLDAGTPLRGWRADGGCPHKDLFIL